MARFPARLHVLLASRSPLAVVLRRGPANQVCSILWNRATNAFSLGQWLRGRIYERRSDLSPDGRHMIYFAMNGRWQSEARGSWTAISIAPWLKAIRLYPKGDCWNGGGLFTSNTSYWLNGGFCGQPLIREDKLLKRDLKYRPEHYGNECTGVYYVRLQRDGWKLVETMGVRFSAGTVFEKQLPHGWILRKWARADIDHPEGAGCYWDEHELEHSGRKILLPQTGWEWADFDGDWLMWAAQGCLWRAKAGREGNEDPFMIKDFNDMKFERREAPYSVAR